MDQSALLASLVERGFTLLLALVLARLLGALALTAVARACTDPARRSRAAGLAVRIGPGFARGAIAAVVGAGAVAAVGGPALAASPPRPVVSQAAVPDLDRLVVLPAAPTPPRAGTSEVHVVRRGESLWSIAADALGPSATPSAIAASWPRWYATNRTTVGRDPALLHPGQRLRPPASVDTGLAR